MTTSRASGNRVRGTVAVLLLVVGAVLLPVSIIARWAHANVLDNSGFTAAVAPLSADPQVRATVSTALSQRAEAALSSSDVIASLPPALAGLGSQLTAVLAQQIQAATTTFVASDAFATAWTQANTEAQGALVTALQGQDSAAIKLRGSQVVLDTGVFVQQLRDQLAASGLSALSQIPLPQGVSQQVVLLDSTQLQAMAVAYPVLSPVAPWLIAVALALLALAVLVAARRLLALAWVGVVLLLTFGALVLFAQRGEAALAANLTPYSLQGLAAPYWAALASGLHTWTIAVLALGVVLLVAGGTGALLTRGQRRAA
ncbi:MAG: hypothetical protein ABI468_01880 [Candidatus Nanopelagicales bacterium]